MAKIVLTKEMHKKEELLHPFTIFGKKVSVPIPLSHFKETPEIHAEVSTITIKGAKLVPHQSRSASQMFRFDYNLEISEDAYHDYKELGSAARPFLFSFVAGEEEIISLSPMCEVGLHAKKLYLVSFVDEEKKLALLANKNKFIVNVAALSLNS